MTTGALGFPIGTACVREIVMSEPFVLTVPQNTPLDTYAILQNCREHYLKHLAVIARNGGIHTPSAQEAWARGAGGFFDEMVSSKRKGFEQARGLTASRISLVGDCELEQELRRGEIVTHLYDACAESLWRLHLRMITLLQRPALSLSDNPVSPDGISQGLAELCIALGKTQDEALELLASMEEVLALQLPEVYGELNALLAGLQVEPAQVQRNTIQTPTGKRGESAGGSGRAVEDPLSSLMHVLLGQSVVAGPPGGSLQSIDSQRLERLLEGIGLQEAGSPVSSADAQEGAGRARSIPSPAALNARRLGVGGADGAAIDALAMIFEAIFAHPNLAEGAKVAIVSLQIPVLKLALQDASFFSNHRHPVRILLDRMAGLAVGVPQKAGVEHPICNRLSQLAASLRSTPQMTAEICERSVQELEQAMACREQAVQEVLQTYLALGELQEQRDLALVHGRQLLQQYLQHEIPVVFVDFLHRDWIGVLQAAYVNGGEAGKAWLSAKAVIDDLLWCFAPKPTLEARKQLVALVPVLLKRITAGLAGIGRGMDADSPFLDACFALQTSAMRGRSLEAPNPGQEAGFIDLSSSNAPFDGGGFGLTELDFGGRILKVVRPTNFGPLLRVPTGLNQGEWVEFLLPGGKALCGYLGWISPAGALLFVNPDWTFAVSMAPGFVENQLRTHEARRCDQGGVFDAAAERAIQLMV